MFCLNLRWPRGCLPGHGQLPVELSSAQRIPFLGRSESALLTFAVEEIPWRSREVETSPSNAAGVDS